MPGRARSTAGRSGSRPGTPRCPPPRSPRPAAPPRRRPRPRWPRAEASSSIFYVDTLEYLRRGGRIGAAAALFGGALAVKPLLQIADGKVASLERVRTSGRALARLEELAVAGRGRGAGRRLRGAPGRPGPGRAAHRAPGRRGSRTTSTGREVWCGELGAVLGAHVGPGMLAVCVAPAALTEPPVRPQVSAVGRFSTGRASGSRCPGRPVPSVAGMRSRRPSPEHQDAVSRRLALLSAELSAVRPPPPDPTRPGPSDGEWWDEHTRIAAPRQAPPAHHPPPPSARARRLRRCRCPGGTPRAVVAGRRPGAAAPCGAACSSGPRSSPWWRCWSRSGWR